MKKLIKFLLFLVLFTTLNHCLFSMNPRERRFLELRARQAEEIRQKEEAIARENEVKLGLTMSILNFLPENQAEFLNQAEPSDKEIREQQDIEYEFTEKMDQLITFIENTSNLRIARGNQTREKIFEFLLTLDVEVLRQILNAVEKRQRIDEEERQYAEYLERENTREEVRKVQERIDEERLTAEYLEEERLTAEYLERERLTAEYLERERRIAKRIVRERKEEEERLTEEFLEREFRFHN